MEGTMGEIRMFAGTFAPRNWAFCDGQLLSVSQNDALFSLLGTQYGGDGRTTFGLPDLRGRSPMIVNWKSKPWQFWTILYLVLSSVMEAGSKLSNIDIA